MSKEKKKAYAEREKAAAAAASARQLTSLGESAPPPSVKKVKPRKQSRGK